MRCRVQVVVPCVRVCVRSRLSCSRSENHTFCRSKCDFGGYRKAEKWLFLGCGYGFYRFGAAQSQRTIRFVGPNAISAGIEKRKSGYSLGAGAISIDFELLQVRKPYVLLVQMRFASALGPILGRYRVRSYAEGILQTFG